MTINVLQEDIERGIRGNPRSCAVSLAAARAGLKNSYTTIGYLYYEKYWGFADEITQWICDYDNLKPVEPIKFDIDYILPIETS